MRWAEQIERLRAPGGAGGEVGEVAALPVADAGTAEMAYLTDPENNIIEVQHWTYE